jgi:hypothetical protein
MCVRFSFHATLTAHQYMLTSLGWTVETNAQLALYVLERVSFSLLAGFSVLFNLVTGAAPGFPPRVFQLCQSTLLVAYAYDHVFYWQEGNSPGAPDVHFSFLFIDTTARSVALSAATSLTFFLVKQLLKSFLKPQYSQLLHPRYKLKECPPQPPPAAVNA